jgi:hypothetical protein
MTLLGKLRGRWSTQSQKAALRSSPHLGPTGCGVRSRNLAIETFERLCAAGVPERLCFATAEVVRSGLANGDLRSPHDTVKDLVDVLYDIRKNDTRDILTAAFPDVKLTEARKARKDEEAEAVTGKPSARSPKLSGLVADHLAPKGADAYRGKKDASWPAVWRLPDLVLMDALAGADRDLRKQLMTVFRADQPLLFSRCEIAWKERLENDVIAAWKSRRGPEAVSEVLERAAPGGKVQSPMPKEEVDIDIALFGRMVASLPEATVEAAASFAHSMTVGEFQIEADFFTAAEERPRDGNDRGGHMAHAFWGSGIHHRYCAVDMNLLRANLEKGGRSSSVATEMAEDAMKRVVTGFATTVPHGKSTNSAPFSPASYVMLERGAAPATNLSVAFSRPIPPDVADPMASAIARLREFKVALSRVYGEGKVVELCAYPGLEPIEGAPDSLAVALDEIAR